MPKISSKWEYVGCYKHNGEYVYKCTRCGETDWIASYGTEEQLKCKCGDKNAKN